MATKPKAKTTNKSTTPLSRALASVTKKPTNYTDSRVITTPLSQMDTSITGLPSVPTPSLEKVDTAAALRKLQSGQALTYAEKVALGLATQPATAGTQTPPATDGTSTPPATDGTSTPPETKTEVPVGTNANANDLLTYFNAINAANAALGKAGIANTLAVREATAAGDVGIRGAGREMYQAGQAALGSLGERGLLGGGGIGYAAVRAAQVAPLEKKLQAISTMARQVSAADTLLAEEQAKQQQAILDAGTNLTKVTNTYNKLGGK